MYSFKFSWMDEKIFEMPASLSSLHAPSLYKEVPKPAKTRLLPTSAKRGVCNTRVSPGSE